MKAHLVYIESHCVYKSLGLLVKGRLIFGHTVYLINSPTGRLLRNLLGPLLGLSASSKSHPAPSHLCAKHVAVDVVHYRLHMVLWCISQGETWRKSESTHKDIRPDLV